MNHQPRMPRLSQRLSERNQTALAALVDAENAAQQKRAELDGRGPAAMQQLVAVANGCTGQSHHCRRVLLAVYNGAAWPLDPTRLRVIDHDLQNAALTVLEWSLYAFDEPHTYLPDGDKLLQRFASIETPKEQ